jgi:hypothetical protein
VKRLLAVDRLEILILVDNVTDMLSTVSSANCCVRNEWQVH